MLRNSIISKNIISMILLCAMMVGFTSCLNISIGDKKAVTEAAEELADNMISIDASKLIKNSTLNVQSDEAVALQKLLSNDRRTEDEIKILKSVENTIEYEIDEKSVSVNKNKASVDIIFKIADYSNVFLGTYKGIDNITSAIMKADKTEVVFNAEFVKEDNDWIPDNVGSKSFFKLYDYRNTGISIVKVLRVAEKLADDMASVDFYELYKHSTIDKRSDAFFVIEELLSNNNRDDIDVEIFNAIEDTIEYKIDKDSVYVSGNEASINIVFKLADYSKVLEKDYKNMDELIDSIANVDTVEVKYTAEFVKEDNDWILSNIGCEEFMSLYDYRNADYSKIYSMIWSADLAARLIDRTMSSFWDTENNKYVNTRFIEYDYFFDIEIYNYGGYGINAYFTLSKDGKPIYTSPMVPLGDSSNFVCRVDVEDVDQDSFLYFESGNYTINLYIVEDDGDKLIDTESIIVERI